jgi:hypothetical protein
MSEETPNSAAGAGELSVIQEELRSLKAELVLSRLLATQALGMLIRRSNEPRMVHEQITRVGRERLEETPLSRDPEHDKILRSVIMQLHETVLAELAPRDVAGR